MYKDLIKKFLQLLLPLIVSIGGLVFCFYLFEVESTKQSYQNNENINIKIGKLAMTTDLESIASDLMVLAQHNVFLDMTSDSLNPNAVSVLTDCFLGISLYKQLYDQVRFLDLNGREIIRVNFNNGYPFSVSNNELQDKSKRYYFKDVIRLNKGQIFVSPFDLNIEHGQVERPFKPMLRFGTPVFNKQGEKKGILLLNYLGSKLLAHLKEVIPNTISDVMLLNAEGFWLYHHRPELEWGFILGNEYTFGKSFPVAWEKISKTRAGQFYDTDGGLFTFETVYPLQEGQESTTGAIEAYEPSRGKISGKAYYWKLIDRIPNEIFSASANQIAWKLFIIVTPLFILLTFGCWWLASVQIQRQIEGKQAETALRKERALLAQKVKRRTMELQKVNAELAHAAHIKDEFLANMSHELRTPLNAVLTLSEMLQDETYGPLDNKQLKPIKLIESSGKHLLSLINDILDLSKIEAGKMTLKIGEVGTNEICQASLQFVKQIALNKRVKVLSRYNNTATTLQADERCLKQILVNLLTNAVKFTPKGGKVVLEVSTDQNQELIHFIVSDTGIGIPEDQMKHLFQPFVQIDSRLNRQHEGTGLGLSLVYRLTDMQGGSVTVESKVGEGSRFTVSLPWRPGEGVLALTDDNHTDNKNQPSTISPRQPSVLVLLAEDNEININIIREALQANGYQWVIAKNGVEVIEKAIKTKPDVILMDIQMPTMDGLEATRRIRADPNLTQIPIIALTALAMPGDREQCLAAGANDYLSKPVSIKKLLKAIEAQLSFIV